MFWGAPLIARELETGTYRLAWTQGVTRARWLITRLAVVGGASMVAAGLMSWLLTWWSSPIDTLNASRFGTTVFDSAYIAPIGYAAFGFALGVLAGVLWRRTVPAMATTLAVFACRARSVRSLRTTALDDARSASLIDQALTEHRIRTGTVRIELHYWRFERTEFTIRGQFGRRQSRRYGDVAVVERHTARRSTTNRRAREWVVRRRSDDRPRSLTASTR